MTSDSRSATRTVATVHIARTLPALVAATLLSAQALTAGAQIELGKPTVESTPTTLDLNGVDNAPDGEVIAVGDGGTVLRRTVSMGNPTWTSLGAWASNYFTAEVFTVAHSPATYPAGNAWVIGGRNAVVETDFTNNLEIDVRPGSGTIFTPVLATADEIWYGVPDLGLFPSFLHRYDRTNQTNPGIAFTLGAVLAMCQVPGGNLRYVTTDGDIEEVDDNLQVTVLYDQPNSDPLELNAASFSPDCQVIAAGDAGFENRIYAGFIDSTRGSSFVPWRFRSRPGEPTVTASEFLTNQEQGNVVGFFAVFMRCNDNIPTGDEAAMSAFSDFLNSRILSLETANALVKCQREGTILPVTNRRAPGAPQVVGFELLTVGRGGYVELTPGQGPMFGDSFETGDFSQWSSVTQ